MQQKETHNLPCPIKTCSYSIKISDHADNLEIVMCANDMKLHLKAHSLNELLNTLFQYSIHQLEQQQQNQTTNKTSH